MRHVEGGCKCGAVRYSAKSPAAYPYLRCYCSICRKTGGGGGYMISINLSFSSLVIEGRESIGAFHAMVEGETGKLVRSPVGRQFCHRCGSALFARGADWEDVISVAASSVDSDLPLPPSISHMMLGSKANWVVPNIGPNDETFDEFPDKTLEEWHRSQGLWEG